MIEVLYRDEHSVCVSIVPDEVKLTKEQLVNIKRQEEVKNERLKKMVEKVTDYTDTSKKVVRISLGVVGYGGISKRVNIGNIPLNVVQDIEIEIEEEEKYKDCLTNVKELSFVTEPEKQERFGQWYDKQRKGRKYRKY